MSINFQKTYIVKLVLIWKFEAFEPIHNFYQNWSKNAF